MTVTTSQYIYKSLDFDVQDIDKVISLVRLLTCYLKSLTSFEGLENNQPLGLHPWAIKLPILVLWKNRNPFNCSFKTNSNKTRRRIEIGGFK